MFTTLLRRLRGLPLLVLALLSFSGIQEARASHLFGGEMTYRYLDATGPTGNAFRYEVTLSVYNNSGSSSQVPTGRPNIELGFYLKNGTRIVLPANMPLSPGSSLSVASNNSQGGNIIINQTSRVSVTRVIPSGCAVGGFAPPDVILVKYTTVVCLPVSLDGYYCFFSDNSRTNPITNLQTLNGGGSGGGAPGTGNLTLYLDMAGPLIPNSAPVFSDTAVALVCQGDTTLILNSATDADGDRLVYSFGTPYAGDYQQQGNAPASNLYNPPAAFTPPPPSVTYAAGFSATLPFGAGSVATLNATTGLSTYIARGAQGFYVVAVDVNEYRRNPNGTETLVGRTRRDLQLVVRQCPPGNAPVIQSVGGTGGTGGVPRNFTVEEGQLLQFPITSNTNPGGSALSVRINSSLLDGGGATNASYNGDQGVRPAGSTTGTVTVSGTGPLIGTFSFRPACGTARTTPYDVLTTASVLCTTKSKSEVFQVTVTRAAAPTSISGPTQICDPATVRTYSAAGPASPTYNWHVVGGTITSGQGTGTVQVRWNSTTTTGRLSLKGISAFGCNTDSVVQAIDIRPLAALTVTASAAIICRGASTTLTVTGPTGVTYTWTGGAQTFTGPSITVSPTATTIYTVTGSDGTCTTTAQSTITVTPPPTVTPGAPVTICPGQTAQLGVAPAAGFTYSWSPTTGLSNPTIANPIVTGINTTGTNITTTYTLTVTATAGGCISTGTVAVTVTPPLTVSAGPAVSFCSGSSAQIGTAPVAGFTYSWTPTTGLSSPTVANPTVTGTNTTSAPITTTYTLTVTNATGCQGSATVAVTVNPAPTVVTGPAVSFCSGASAQLGGPAVTGLTYSWSPATGLSSTTVANPTVTGTNTTGIAIVTTYTLTVTSTNGCSNTGTVVVTLNPAAVAVAGADRTQCGNITTTLGTTPVAGTTYSWTPTTGLSSPTSANPVLTLVNSGTTVLAVTYTLTATTAAGCTATSSVTVTSNPAAIALPLAAVSICSGGSAPLSSTPAVAGTTYSWTPTTGLSDPTSATPTVTGTNTTNATITRTYTLTATNAFGCTATATTTVSITPAIAAQAGADRTVCSGIGTALGAAPVAGLTYRWSPATNLSSATVANPTATITNTGSVALVRTYRLTVTNAQGCTGTDSVAVTVYPAVVVNPGPDLIVCSGDTGRLGTPALPGYTYNWITTPQSGIVLSANNIAQPTFTATNNTAAAFFRIIVLQVTDANGCTGQSQVRLDINPAAEANAGPDLPVCSGYNSLVGWPVTVPSPGTTYSWAPTTGLAAPTSPTSLVTLTNTTNTPVTVTYVLTVTTANGCVATDSVNITVTPLAIANAGPDVAVCDHQQVTLGTAALPNYTYQWTPATGLSSATAAQPVLMAVNTTSAPITLQYMVRAFDTTNAIVQCPRTDTVLVTINPRPATAAITGSASVCPTVTGVAYSVVNPIGTAYQWLAVGGTVVSGQGTPAITVDWGAAGTGSVQVYSLNSFLCSSDTTVFPVIINPILQTPRPTGPGDVTNTAPNNAVCQANGPYTYATTPYTNGSLYAWTIIGGTQVSTNLNTVTVSWNPVTVPTIGKIVVTETSNPSSGVRCLGVSDTLRVLINPTPLGTLVLTGPARVCQGNAISFTLPGGFTGSTYAFQLGGQPVASTGSTLSLPVQTTPGTYVVTVRETSAQGCAGPLLTTTFTVDPTPVAATITGPAFVCNFSIPGLPPLTMQYSVPNTTGSTYQWVVTGGAITAGQGTSQVTVYFVSGQSVYGVSVAETSARGCAGPSTSLTVLPDNPSLSLTLASVVATSNTSIDLTFATTGSANTPNGVQVLRRVAGQGNFTVVATVPATVTTYTDATVDAAANSYEYQLALTNGCGTTLPTATVQTIRLQATTLVGTGGRDQGSTTLTWNPYVGFAVKEYRVYRANDAGNYELIPDAQVTGTTTLTATVPNGTASTATGSGFSQQFRVVAVSTDATPLLSNSNTTGVDFTNAVATYNVITPDGDNLNDVLVFDNISLYGGALTIFNRWGREVYTNPNYHNDWGGQNQSAGTYYYILKLNNGTVIKNWFEIVK